MTARIVHQLCVLLSRTLAHTMYIRKVLHVTARGMCFEGDKRVLRFHGLKPEDLWGSSGFTVKPQGVLRFHDETSGGPLVSR